MNWASPTVRTLVLAAALVAVLAVLPQFLSLYWLRIATGALMLAVVAQGINLMAGMLGYPAFGNVVFFGIGAYGTTISMASHGQSLAVGLLVGALTAAVLALLMGPLLLRLRGHYFAIATLGLNEATSAVVANLTGLTGGGTGMSLPLAQGDAAAIAHASYFRFVLLFAASLAVVVALRDSRFGLACRAIRANEEAAASAGVDALRVKTATWIMSAAMTAVAGGLYARWVGFIEPTLVFDMSISVKAFVMFLLGGAGTVFGPFVGAALIETITTLAWSHLLKVHLLVLGAAIMFVVLVLPNGLQAFVLDRLRLMRLWRREAS